MERIDFATWKALPDSEKSAWTVQNDGSFVKATNGPRPPEDEVSRLRREVAEFRENNLALKRQLEEKGKDTGAPLEQTASLTAQLAEEKRARQELQERFEAKERQIARQEFRDRLLVEGKKVHMLPDAVDDLMFRAEREGFQLKDGAIVALDEQGNVKQSVKVQGAALTITEWMNDQRSNGAGHLFGSPSGAGDASGPGNPLGGTFKPGTKVLMDASNEQLLENLGDVAEGKAVLQSSTQPLVR